MAELRIRRRQQRLFGHPAKGGRRTELSGLFARYGRHSEPVLGGVSGFPERISTGQFLPGGCRRRSAERPAAAVARAALVLVFLVRYLAMSWMIWATSSSESRNR